MDERNIALTEDPDLKGVPILDDEEDGRIGGFWQEDIAAYVGKRKGQIYLQKFRRIRDEGHSWNWAAFLFAGKWLAYRRMYGVSIAFETISVLTGISLAVALLRPLLAGDIPYWLIELLSFGFSFLLRSVVGIIGDRLYWRRTQAILTRAGCHRRAEGFDPQLAARLEDLGDGNIWAVGLILAGSYLFLKLASYGFGRGLGASMLV